MPYGILLDELTLVAVLFILINNNLGTMKNSVFTRISILYFTTDHKVGIWFIEPTCADAWWALMGHFLSVCLSVCDYTKSH